MAYEESDQISKVKDSGKTDLRGFLLTLGNVKVGMEVPKWRPGCLKDTEEPNSSLVMERLIVTGKPNILRGRVVY